LISNDGKVLLGYLITLDIILFLGSYGILVRGNEITRQVGDAGIPSDDLILATIIHRI